METLKIEEIKSIGKTIENAKRLAEKIEAINRKTVNVKTSLEKKQKIASEHLNEISSCYEETFMATKEYVNFIVSNLGVKPRTSSPSFQQRFCDRISVYGILSQNLSYDI